MLLSLIYPVLYWNVYAEHESQDWVTKMSKARLEVWMEICLMLCFIEFLHQIKNSSSSSLVACDPIRVAAMRRTSPSFPCVGGRGTSYAAMTDLWSSPTCYRCEWSQRESGSCCHIVEERRSWRCHFGPRLYTFITLPGGSTTPPQSARAGLVWSGRLWPSSSAPSSCTRESRAIQDSRHN